MIINCTPRSRPIIATHHCEEIIRLVNWSVKFDILNCCVTLNIFGSLFLRIGDFMRFAGTTFFDFSPWACHLVVVVELVCLSDPKSCAVGDLVPDGFNRAGLVEG